MGNKRYFHKTAKIDTPRCKRCFDQFRETIFNHCGTNKLGRRNFEIFWSYTGPDGERLLDPHFVDPKWGLKYERLREIVSKCWWAVSDNHRWMHNPSAKDRAKMAYDE